MIAFRSSPHHFLKHFSDWPPCSIPATIQFQYGTENNTGSGEKHHWPGKIGKLNAERLDVFEVEDVAMDKSALHLLIGPIDEQSIILKYFGLWIANSCGCGSPRSLCSQGRPRRKWALWGQVAPNTCPGGCKALALGQVQKQGLKPVWFINRLTNKKRCNLSPALDGFVHFVQKVAFPNPLRVPDRGGVGCFGDEQIGTKTGRNFCCIQMPVRGHVEVARVENLNTYLSSS